MIRSGSVVAALLVCVAASAFARERVVTLESRPGVALRVLVAVPESPLGSVILLAGSHGNLQIADDGRLGWGGGNQLLRTRSEYVRAGFATAVPDVAEDLRRPGGGVVGGYRWSEPHALDLGALVRHLRTIAQPVYLVGTSRAAMSVANAAVRTEGDARPDAIVITAGMLMERSPKQPNVQRDVGRLGRISIPALIVHHVRDECAYTPAADVEPFARLLTGSPRVETRLLEGGFTRGDPCDAQSYHGFLGIDAEVVRVVTGWLRQLAAESHRK